MKTFWLEHDYKQAAAKLKSRSADPSNATKPLTEDTKVISPNGRPAALYLRQVIPVGLQLRAYELLKGVNNRVTNRPGALGTHSLPQYINADGSPSPRRGVHKLVSEASPARQETLGWDRPDHQTRSTVKHPEMLEGIQELIELEDRLYEQHLRPCYVEQQAVLENVPWKLWGTVFTTVYVAKRFQTAYHRDGNLKGTMTAITPLGTFSGGALILLRWRIAIPYLPGDLVIFDAEELHGNLPFEGDRISLASYCAGLIAK
jgi:hypothetical protein